MNTALIFALAIFCGLTLCARKHAHLDYKTTDIAYPLRHKEYFDLKYKTSGVADPWRHKKYIDLEERSSEAADPWRHKKHIDLEDTASDSRNYTHVHVRCKSLIQTYNNSKHIFLQRLNLLEKDQLN